MSPTKPSQKPPNSLGRHGKLFWKSVTEVYVISDGHHLKLLEHAALCIDRAVAAREAIAKEGITCKNRFGELREHPAMNTERQAMQVHRQLIRELGLDVEPASVTRGPSRPGTRRS